MLWKKKRVTIHFTNILSTWHTFFSFLTYPIEPYISRAPTLLTFQYRMTNETPALEFVLSIHFCTFDILVYWEESGINKIDICSYILGKNNVN